MSESGVSEPETRNRVGGEGHVGQPFTCDRCGSQVVLTGLRVGRYPAAALECECELDPTINETGLKIPNEWSAGLFNVSEGGDGDE